MPFTSTRLPYRQTGAFSKIALDYLDQAASLKPFFAHPPSPAGMQKAMEARKGFANNREILVGELKKQYAGINTTEKVRKNIESLLSQGTFTITTAHQNNIFTGPLYFIYKILHVIRLADQLKDAFPNNHFVPVFYIGTEDADLEELNHIYLGPEKLVWNTGQTGAVGRMKADKELVKLVDRIEGELSVLPNGKEICALFRQYYREGLTIADTTFGLVNDLFSEYGLVILLPDNAALKRQMIPLFKDELLQQRAAGIVEQSTARLEAAGYKMQAHPREINLFYLKDNIRARIVKQGAGYKVQGEGISFSEAELLDELETYPDRFSPNVILRGLYQETILPNIAFVGGAGETAYWLQYKDLFEHYRVPFPMLVLRNSFLIVDNKAQEKIAKLGFSMEDLFLPEEELMNRLVARESGKEIKLNGSLEELTRLYESIKKQAVSTDPTLEKHVEALKTRTVYRISELEKKMLRAEKRKFSDQRRQLHAVKEQLFPGNGLQERHDNLAYYYARWGRDFIDALYRNSLGLEGEFVVLKNAE